MLKLHCPFAKPKERRNMLNFCQSESNLSELQFRWPFSRCCTRYDPRGDVPSESGADMQCAHAALKYMLTRVT